MRFDSEKYQRMLRWLRTHQCTVTQLVDRYGIAKITVYRWLTRARDEGHDVIKRGSGSETIYQINEG